MKPSTMYVLIALILSTLSMPSQAEVWRRGDVTVSVTYDNARDLSRLKQLDLPAVFYQKEAFFFLRIDQVDLIAGTGLPYTVTERDRSSYAPPVRQASEDCTLYEFHEIIAEIDDLAMQYPSICMRMDIGTSINGEPLVAVKISDNVTVDENEPEIILDGAIHGDEDLPEAILTCFMRELCEQYSNDLRITDIIDNTEIWIIPAMNPYGLLYGTRPNFNFVDLNRDWGYMHGDENLPGGDTYYSQQETRHYRDFFMSRNATINISYHSGIQGIIYPWYSRPEPSPDHQAVLNLANLYDESSGYPPGEFAVTSGYDLYSTHGSSPATAYGAMGTLSFGVEILNYSDWWPGAPATMYDYNKEPMLQFIEKASEGIQGVVKDEISGNRVAAAVFVEDFVPFYSNSLLGDFHSYLLPGTYAVRVTASGYEDKTIENVVIQAGSATDLAVELTPQANYGIHRIIACRNNDNLQDEAHPWACIGMPDAVNYSLGDAGYVVVDMLNSVVNIAGNDLTVFEGDGSAEDFEIFASGHIDGPWVSLGIGTGTTSFDLDAVGLSSARYLKLEDPGTGTGDQPDAGFDLDAICAELGLVSSVSENTPESPANFALHDCFPNPFNPRTTISFDLALPSEVSLRIYSVSGRRIRTVIGTRPLEAGRHSVVWSGQDDAGQPVASGLYFYRLETENFQAIKRMTLLK